MLSHPSGMTPSNKWVAVSVDVVYSVPYHVKTSHATAVVSPILGSHSLTITLTLTGSEEQPLDVPTTV